MKLTHAAAPFAVALLLISSFLALSGISNAAPEPLPTSFIFTAAGDFGGTGETDNVLNGIAASGAQFHLTLGDLSYGSLAPETAWCSYVQNKIGPAFPFELVSGNHDMDGQPTGHINTFAACLPDHIGNLTGTYGKQYYFDYQNLARVIFIAPNLTLDGELYTYNVGTARYNWLVSAIDSARTANIPWVIVAMHKNCISTGLKSCEIGTDLFNLLITKKVDLVLQGHDHNYQRSKQLAFNANCTMIVPVQYDAPCVNDDGADQTYPKGGGMLLMIAGTGGVSLYPSNPMDAEAGYFARFFVPSVDTPSYGFLKINVTAAQMNGQFIATSAGATFTDAFQIGGSPPPPPHRRPRPTPPPSFPKTRHGNISTTVPIRAPRGAPTALTTAHGQQAARSSAMAMATRPPPSATDRTPTINTSLPISANPLASPTLPTFPPSPSSSCAMMAQRSISTALPLPRIIWLPHIRTTRTRPLSSAVRTSPPITLSILPLRLCSTHRKKYNWSMA